MIKLIFLGTLLGVLFIKNTQAQELILKATFILPLDTYIEALIPNDGEFVRPPNDVYVIFNWGPNDSKLTPIEKFGIKKMYLRSANNDFFDGTISVSTTLAGKFMLHFRLNKQLDILKRYFVEIHYNFGTYKWDFYVVLPSDTGGVAQYADKVTLSVGENVCPMDVYFEIVSTTTSPVTDTLLPLQDCFYHCNFLYKSKATQATGLKLKDYAVLRLKYKDIGDDGIVDGTRIGELSLKGVYLSGGVWKRDYELCKVYPDRNEVLILIDDLDTFGLVAAIMSNLSYALCCPNPFDLTKYSKVTFKNLPVDVKVIKIYTLDGDLIREISPSYNEAHWDGKDKKGDIVSSGIYFWLIKRPGEHKVGKLTLIR